MTTIGYTTTEDLLRVLGIQNASPEQEADAVRVLTAALVEITSEIDIHAADGDLALSADEEELAAEVQLERANEHWQQVIAPFGILGIGDTGAVYTARDSWDRHALKLAPLKRSWGIA